MITDSFHNVIQHFLVHFSKTSQKVSLGALQTLRAAIAMRVQWQRLGKGKFQPSEHRMTVSYLIWVTLVRLNVKYDKKHKFQIVHQP